MNMYAEQAILMGGFAFFLLTGAIGLWLLIKPPKWRKRTVQVKPVYVTRYERRSGARGQSAPLTPEEKSFEPELPFVMDEGADAHDTDINGTAEPEREALDLLVPVDLAPPVENPIAVEEGDRCDAAVTLETPGATSPDQDIALDQEPTEVPERPTPLPVSQWVPVESFGNKAVVSAIADQGHKRIADEAAPISGRRRSLAAITEAAWQQEAVADISGEQNLVQEVEPQNLSEPDDMVEPQLDHNPVDSEEAVELAEPAEAAGQTVFMEELPAIAVPVKGRPRKKSAQTGSKKAKAKTPRKRAVGAG